MPAGLQVMSISTGGWIKYARMIEEAGADALELNVYIVPSDPHVVGAQIDQATIDLVREVRQSVQIPRLLGQCQRLRR